MSAPVECPANLADRYGLQLVEEPPPQRAEEPARAPRSSGFAGLRVFDWALLAVLAGVQIAHLFVLATFARWAMRWFLEA